MLQHCVQYWVHCQPQVVIITSCFEASLDGATARFCSLAAKCCKLAFRFEVTFSPWSLTNLWMSLTNFPARKNLLKTMLFHSIVHFVWCTTFGYANEVAYLSPSSWVLVTVIIFWPWSPSHRHAGLWLWREKPGSFSVVVPWVYSSCSPRWWSAAMSVMSSSLLSLMLKICG